MRFPVVIHRDETSGYGVTVPDLPGCFSADDSIEEATLPGHEAIACHLEGLLMDGEPIPERAPVETHQVNLEYKDGIWALIEVDVSKLSPDQTREHRRPGARTIESVVGSRHVDFSPAENLLGSSARHLK